MELFLFWIAGNKGVDADIFILEEAARIPRDILEEVIAPMLKMKNSVFIGLSTNMGRDNYFSQLFNKKGSEFDDLFLKVRRGGARGEGSASPSNPTRFTAFLYLRVCIGGSQFVVRRLSPQQTQTQRM